MTSQNANTPLRVEGQTIHLCPICQQVIASAYCQVRSRGSSPPFAAARSFKVARILVVTRGRLPIVHLRADDHFRCASVRLPRSNSVAPRPATVPARSACPALGAGACARSTASALSSAKTLTGRPRPPRRPVSSWLRQARRGDDPAGFQSCRRPSSLVRISNTAECLNGPHEIPDPISGGLQRMRVANLATTTPAPGDRAGPDSSGPSR